MSDNKGLEMFGRGFFYVSQWCSHLISSSIFWRNMDFAWFTWFHMVSPVYFSSKQGHTCWISSTSREVWTTSKKLDQWKMTIWPRFCSCVRQALFKFLHFPTSALRLLVQILRGRNVASDCCKAEGLPFNASMIEEQSRNMTNMNDLGHVSDQTLRIINNLTSMLICRPTSTTYSNISFFTRIV